MRITIEEEIQTEAVGTVRIEVSYESDADTPPRQVLEEAARALLDGGEPVKQANAAPEEGAKRLMGHEYKPPKGIHGKQLRTVHRMVQAVEALTAKGPAASPQEIAEKARLNPASVYGAIKPGNPAEDYVKHLFLVGKHGRSYHLDLTKQGRYVASLIRAGKVPS